MGETAQETPPVALHNELLCFLANRLHCVPYEALLKTCLEFYSMEQIQSAKELLWDEVISTVFAARKEMRHIKRKNTNAGSKEKADMEDILKALQVCDREGTTLPHFYAIDLGNVPPASPGQADMGVVMNLLAQMQTEIKDLRQMFHGQQHSMQVMQETVPKQLRQTDISMQVVQERETIPKQPESWVRVAASSSQAGGKSPPVRPPAAAAPSQVTGPPQQPTQPTVTGVADQRPNQPQPQVDEDGFTMVTRPKKAKSRKPMAVKGSSAATLLKGVPAPPRSLDLFVGRLDTSTTSAGVESHVRWIVGGAGNITVDEITHCVNAYGYKGYKVSVPAAAAEQVFQSEKWPSHVTIKKFYKPKGGSGQGVPAVTRQPRQVMRSASAGDLAAV